MNRRSGARDKRPSSSVHSVYDNLHKTTLFRLSWLLKQRGMPKGYHYAQCVPRATFPAHMSVLFRVRQEPTILGRSELAGRPL